MNKLVCYIIFLSATSCCLVASRQTLFEACEFELEEARKVYKDHQAEFPEKYREMLNNLGYLDDRPITPEELGEMHKEFFEMIQNYSAEEINEFWEWQMQVNKIVYKELQEVIMNSLTEDCINTGKEFFIEMMEGIGIKF